MCDHNCRLNVFNAGYVIAVFSVVFILAMKAADALYRWEVFSLLVDVL